MDPQRSFSSSERTVFRGSQVMDGWMTAHWQWQLRVNADDESAILQGWLVHRAKESLSSADLKTASALAPARAPGGL